MNLKRVQYPYTLPRNEVAKKVARQLFGEKALETKRVQTAGARCMRANGVALG